MPEPLDQEIRTLRTWFWSARDPDGRAFAPLAEAHWRRGDLDEAEALLREGLDRHPDYATGHLVAARVARARRDVDAALVHLNRVLDLDPGNVVALLERADCRISTGDRAEARADLQTVLRLDRGNPEALARLEALRPDDDEGAPSFGWSPEAAPSAESTGQPDASLVSEEAWGATPADVEPDVGGPRVPEAERPIFTRTMGDIYARQGFHERAVEVYEQLSRESPEDAEVAARLAELRGMLEREPREEDELEPALPSPEAPSAFEEASSPEPITEGGAADFDPAERERVSKRTGVGTIEQYFEDLLAWVPGAVPIESLAPHAAPIEPSAGAQAVATESSGPETAVPIESLAPDVDSASGEGDETPDAGLDEFQRWLEGLRP